MAWPERSRRHAELPADWPAIRTRILQRDGYRCTWTDNGIRCTQRATDVDHINDRHNHTDSNLRSLCDWHHKQRTARQGVAARGHGPTRRRPTEPHPGLRPDGGG